MKARIKETGEILEVQAISDYINKYGQFIVEYKGNDGIIYTAFELDFDLEENIRIPDYWTRLEHTYAGMAMQGMVSDSEMFIELGNNKGLSVENAIAKASHKIAHALVQKLKEKEERK